MNKTPPAAKSLRADDLRRRSGLADVRVYSRLRSTNTKAAELLESGGLRLPGAVVASLQSAGRGRGRNAWYADAGSLAVTFAFPIEPNHQPNELPLRAGLAALSAASIHVDASRLHVKWPNDLLADGKKLAGILCERVRGADLVGIGVNISTDLRGASAEVRRRATTIAKLARRVPSRADVFVELAKGLREVWDAGDRWCEEINRVHALTGRDIAVDTGDEVIRGRCTGVDPQGRLLIDDGKQVYRVMSGTIV